jgi:hypothetical protein
VCECAHSVALQAREPAAAQQSAKLPRWLHMPTLNAAPCVCCPAHTRSEAVIAKCIALIRQYVARCGSCTLQDQQAHVAPRVCSQKQRQHTAARTAAAAAPGTSPLLVCWQPLQQHASAWQRSCPPTRVRCNCLQPCDSQRSDCRPAQLPARTGLTAAVVTGGGSLCAAGLQRSLFYLESSVDRLADSAATDKRLAKISHRCVIG